jgi:bifunctional enzyme CysN/CysC
VLYEDHVEALAKLAGRSGSGKIDLSLVTDGLKAEREQGVTIDVAYRYFSTARRRFIVIDAPGHEQYTRNMATGASNADLAVLLVDAKLGLLTQTRRHAFICSLLGIPRIVVALNKMDLVGHSQARFEDIRADFEAFAARLGFKSVTFVPVSALDGDNVVRSSERMPWYSGQPLLEHLETVYIGGDRNLVDFRLPVQTVVRAGGERWYGGRIGSGTVKVGDEVAVLPSHRRSRVRAIALGDKALDSAHAPLSVALALEDDVDVGRGAVLAHPRNLPRGVRSLDAMVVWMGEKPLAPGRVYLAKLGASWVRASCAAVDYRVDPDTLHRANGHGLGLNDIGRASFTLFEERFVDPYARNRSTGAFILVDAESDRTVGAGMIVDRDSEHPRVAPGATAKRVVVPQAGQVTAAERAAILGQRAVTIWLTGLSGAGKSTLAAELEKRLLDRGRACYMLDADSVRGGINRDLGFGPDDRRENIRRVAEVARLRRGADRSRPHLALPRRPRSRESSLWLRRVTSTRHSACAVGARPEGLPPRARGRSRRPPACQRPTRRRKLRRSRSRPALRAWPSASSGCSPRSCAGRARRRRGREARTKGATTRRSTGRGSASRRPRIRRRPGSGAGSSRQAGNSPA